MKRIIGVKVDVTKIDKARLFEGRNGAKYLDLVLIETPGGQYGDWMAVQGVSREEKAAGVRGAILGNGKNLGDSKSPSQPPPEQPELQANDDVPF